MFVASLSYYLTKKLTRRCAEEGFDLVRITVQGKREAAACKKIREELDKRGYDTIALCADMHFNPAVALMVADAVEKVSSHASSYCSSSRFKLII